MRGLKILGAILFAGASAGSVAVGCAAQGSSGDVTTDSGTDAHADADSTTAADTAPFDSGAPDSARDSTAPPPKDSGADSAADAGLDAPPDVIEEVGSPCSSAGQVQTRECGICGTQTSSCTGSVWGPFGTCSGELDGGCLPDAMVMEVCGFCGMRMRVCASDCEYAVSACTGQVASGCVPGTIDFEPDPTCDDAGVMGKAKTCSTGCAFGAPSACEAPPATLVVAASPTAVVDTVVDLLPNQQIPSLQTFLGCPQTIDDAGANPDTSYGYVTVTNPTAKIAVVSIWTSKTASGPMIDTMITSYVGSAVPATIAARESCTGTVTDFCADMSDPTSCQTGWGGLMIGDGNAVSMGPASSVVVYVAAVLPTAQGPLRLSARTESLN